MCPSSAGKRPFHSEADNPTDGWTRWAAGTALGASHFHGNLSPENEQFIQHELESRVCHHRGEFLDDAVSLLKRRRDLQREILSGIDSGPGIPAGEVFARLQDKARKFAAGDSR